MQEWVIDCWVCCHPIVVHVDLRSGVAAAVCEREGG
ncbi:MAG: CPXCG motif-containing cysteine-rich protein [Acidobacteriota bacterium]|nr:CPXCG motif-containing cysteine-rich protein [Acidobacteriota bacterium]